MGFEPTTCFRIQFKRLAVSAYSPNGPLANLKIQSGILEDVVGFEPTVPKRLIKSEVSDQLLNTSIKIPDGIQRFG